MCRMLSQRRPAPTSTALAAAVGEAVTAMGDLYQQSADQDVGYAERALAQTAGAMLRLATPSDDAQQAAQAAEAKVGEVVEGGGAVDAAVQGTLADVKT